MQRSVYFDVDDTLILWDHEKYSGLRVVDIQDPYIKTETNWIRVAIHKKHVDWLIRMSKRGEFIVVWSAGGRLWAEAVVDRLGLKPYVNVCLGKPDTIYDDQDPETWMPTKPRWDNPI